MEEGCSTRTERSFKTRLGVRRVSLREVERLRTARYSVLLALIGMMVVVLFLAAGSALAGLVSGVKGSSELTREGVPRKR